MGWMLLLNHSFIYSFVVRLFQWIGGGLKELRIRNEEQTSVHADERTRMQAKPKQASKAGMG